MRTLARGAALRAGLGAVLGFGCYRHVPVTLEQVSPGDFVRVLIQADRAEASAAQRTPEVRTIRGTVTEREGGHVVFSVSTSPSAVPRASRHDHERVSVAPDILRIDLRRLDGKRTARFVALVTAGAILATITGSRVGGGLDQASPAGDDSIRGILDRACCR